MIKKRKKSSPVLTIAIPHLNDPEGLLCTLASVCPYISDDLEVIVFENRSNKVFETRLKELRQRFVRVEFIQSDVKLDYDANVDRCFQKSRGEYVWTIGCGDFPKGKSVANVLRVLKENMDATSFLLLVETSTENTSGYVDAKGTENPDEQRKSVKIDQTFSAALSGNIFKREAWLNQINKGLIFSNWCHVERSLQIQSEMQSKFVEISSHSASIFVDQPKQGWWNQDDHTFLLNTLLFNSILIHYHSNMNLQRYDLPLRSKRVASVLKAILYSRTIKKPAKHETAQQVRNLLTPYQLPYAFYILVNRTPKSLVRYLRQVLRILYRRLFIH